MLTVSTTLRKGYKNLPTHKLLDCIAQDILGFSYELSLVWIGHKRSQTLNHIYRKKDYPTNVLSFPFSKSEGELFITLPLSLREAKRFNTTPHNHILYLFIHGCLHLKGYEHGIKMDKQEQKFFNKFKK